MPQHRYRIMYRSYNRTTQRMAPRLGHAHGQSRWSALRHWWQGERQYGNPCVEVVGVYLDHRGCPQVNHGTHWAYACSAQPQHGDTDA